MDKGEAIPTVGVGVVEGWQDTVLRSLEQDGEVQGRLYAGRGLTCELGGDDPPASSRLTTRRPKADQPDATAMCYSGLVVAQLFGLRCLLKFDGRGRCLRPGAGPESAALAPTPNAPTLLPQDDGAFPTRYFD